MFTVCNDLCMQLWSCGGGVVRECKSRGQRGDMCEPGDYKRDQLSFLSKLCFHET